MMKWPTYGTFKDEQHEGEIIHEVKAYQVIDCIPCGFKHVMPIPDVQELQQEYKHDYYVKDKPHYLREHKEDLDWWNLEYTSRLQSFNEIKSDHLPDTLLDIGSGPGHFLKKAQESGWEATGIEPSVQACAYSKEMGLQVINSFFDEEAIRNLGKYSAVNLSEVLEHVPNPTEILELASKVIEPGGVIGVRVPNDYNSIQFTLTQHDGYEPWWVSPPHHINYFDFDSLTGLMRKTGFEVVKRDATFPIDIFLLMGEDYVGNSNKGREIHGRRKRFELMLDKAGLGLVREQLFQSFGNVGLGRNIILYGKKPGN